MGPALTEASSANAVYKIKICRGKKKKLKKRKKENKQANKQKKPQKKQKKPHQNQNRLWSDFRPSKVELQTVMAFQPKRPRSRLQDRLFKATRLWFTCNQQTCKNYIHTVGCAHMA